ncbi:MAG: T9SS type A sorting domain-containing protein [Saprospiraceae bacterium]
MKQTLLLIFFAFFTAISATQSKSGDNSWGIQPDPVVSQVKISIYPNPATNFISINTDEHVKQINIFNLIGRKLKTINEVVKGQRYDITDLPKGMYLVQVVDTRNKVMTTQRISKR